MAAARENRLCAPGILTTAGARRARRQPARYFDFLCSLFFSTADLRTNARTPFIFRTPYIITQSYSQLIQWSQHRRDKRRFPLQTEKLRTAVNICRRLLPTLYKIEHGGATASHFCCVANTASKEPLTGAFAGGIPHRKRSVRLDPPHQLRGLLQRALARLLALWQELPL